MKHSNKILTVAGSLVLVIVIFFLLGDSILSGMIRKKLEDKPVGTYRVTSQSAEVSLWRGQLVLGNLEVADSGGQLQIFIPELRVRGFQLWRFLIQNEVMLKSVEVVRPEIDMTLTNDSAAHDQKTVDENAPVFQIQQVTVADARLKLLQKQTETNDTIFSTRLNLDLSDLGTTTPPEKYSYESVSCSRLRLALHAGRYLFAKGLYAVEYEELNFDSENRSFHGAKIHLLSQDGKYEIGRKRGVETDWFDMAVPRLAVSGLRLDALLNDTAIVFSKAEIAGFNAQTFRDKRLPFPEKPDTKLLRAMLNDLPVAVHADSVLLADGTISYGERVENSTAAGEVQFTQVQAQLFCLSTIDRLIDRKTTMHVEARAMGQGLLKADFVFPNNQFPVDCQVSGTLRAMDLEAFNPMLVQNAAVRVETGNLNRMAFNFLYNNNRSAGDLLFEYDQLKVHLLDQEDRTNKKVQSFFTNLLVLQKENVRGDRAFREGTIAFERDKKKSLFNYWWKSLLSGIKSIAIL
ncbi:AsmA family protein [Sunxiuqinia dokdonensis]|uniref:DUF748 domain-containing protein n=1 Tax=Sunxiuqinia dokdonensis TaxID=1409788 RepID=A0A0L8VBS9_9BACT|nr:hypothetical protein [Sunxiuqinia dokdonensis]KOH45904.1 hypothetical protein NC99_12800 [Sunxiuqinia dokdonensis]